MQAHRALRIRCPSPLRWNVLTPLSIPYSTVNANRKPQTARLVTRHHPSPKALPRIKSLWSRVRPGIQVPAEWLSGRVKREGFTFHMPHCRLIGWQQSAGNFSGPRPAQSFSWLAFPSEFALSVRGLIRQRTANVIVIFLMNSADARGENDSALCPGAYARGELHPDVCHLDLRCD